MKSKILSISLLFLLFASFGICQISITSPSAGDIWKGMRTIEWSDDTHTETYEIRYSRDNWATSTPIVSGLDSSTRSYSWDTRSVSDSNNYQIEVRRASTYQRSGTFTIDNTPPVSNLTISGTAYKGATINYGGTWYDLSGISRISEVKLYADTDTETSNAVSLVDLTSGETPIVQSGSYGGSFQITDSIWNSIKSYRYIFVRIVVEDGAENQTIDWSNGTPINTSPPSYPFMNPSLPDGIIPLKSVAYPLGINDPTPSPSYTGNPREIDNIGEPTGWYITKPVLTVNPPNFPSGYNIISIEYEIWKKEGSFSFYTGGSVSGSVLTINFSNYPDGIYKIRYRYYVADTNPDPDRYFWTDYYWFPSEPDSGNFENLFGSDPDNAICIDTTPPTFSVFVNKLPDGKWATLKDTGELVQWYSTNPDDRPIIWFLPTENLEPTDESSGIFTGRFTNPLAPPYYYPISNQGIHHHSIEGRDNDPLLNFFIDTQALEEVISDVTPFLYNVPDLPLIPSSVVKQLIRDAGFYFPVYNARGKEIIVRIYDRAGNVGEYKGHPVYWDGNQTVQVPLYVDTIPPRTRVEITTDDSQSLAIWPDWPKDIGIPVDQFDPDDGEDRRWYSWLNNLGFRRPEDATPPSGYPNTYIDYLYFASSENQSRTPTKIRLISTDTPRYIGTPERWSLWPGWYDPKYSDAIRYETQFDQRFSDFSLTNYGSGISDDYNMPKYRITSDTQNDIRNNDALWEDWIGSTIQYSYNNNNLYEDFSSTRITDWSTITNWIFLPKKLTSIEYFAIDNAGNEEKDYYTLTDATNPETTHHIICDEGGGIVKGRVIDDLGKSNLRADDNVPDPDLNLNPSSYNGENGNGWYTSQVNIALTYNDPNNWKDPLSQFLPDIVPGSGIKKFQYAIKNNSSPPSESDFVDYTYGRSISLSDGTYWLYYRAIDNLGNRSGNILRPYIICPNNPIKIDTVYPATTISINGEQITLTATDGGGSGIQFIAYALLSDLSETPNWILYPGSSVTFTLPEGKKIVKYYSKDNAGNQEPEHTSNLGDMDTTDPMTFIQVQGPIYETDTNIYITSNLNSNPTRFILTATDGGGSGIRTGYPKYKLLPSETEYPYTGPFSVFSTTTGIEYWSKDVVNNEEDHKNYPESKTLVIDDTAPNLSFNVSCSDPSKMQNGWYNSLSGMPTVTINSDDGSGSGVSSVLYDLNGGVPSTPYFGSFPLSDGRYNLISKAIDNLGNTTPNTLYPSNPIKVDTTAPVSNLDLSNGVFTLSANDNLSGVESINYVLIYSDSTRSETQTFYSSSIQFVIPSGVKQIEHWAVDNAGNEETHKIWETSDADYTPPQTTITYSQPSYLKGTDLYVTSRANTASLLGKTQFSIIATDPPVNNFTSGIAIGYPKYRIDDSITEETTYTNPFYVAPSDTKIYAYSKDGAGNTETPEKTLSFMIDDEPPSGTTMVIINPPDSETGWYNFDTGAPRIKFTNSTDTGSGVKGIRYTRDGSEPDLGSQFINLDTEFTFEDVKIDAGKFKYAAFDNLENREEIRTYNENIWVDTKRPRTTIIVNDRKLELSVEDEGLSGIWYSQYQFEFDNGNSTDWQTYEGVPVDIPKETKTIYARSFDNAGNNDIQQYSITSNRIISGYVKDYKGNALRGINVLLGGDENQTATTNTSGYYEFINLSPLGDYFVAPLLKNNIPSARIYNGLEENKTNQNFVVVGGWLKGEYDRGSTRDYYFASSSILDPIKISERYSISTTGTDIQILTGILNTDNKMDILFTDNTYLYSYYFTGTTYTKRTWSPKTTSYNLTLLDGIQSETVLDSMVLTGTGQDIAEIYDKDGTKTKTITRESAPSGMEWSAISAGSGNIIFTGFDEDTGTDTILFYNTLTDTTLWETELNQKIIPGTEVLCLREAGKVALLVGVESDTEDLKLVAIDIETGNSLWTKVFTGIKGRITPLVAPAIKGLWDDVVVVRTSTNDSSGSMRVYVLDGATGQQKGVWVAPSTPDTNTSFSAALSDIDNNNITEIVISDGSGNIYIVNLSTGSLVNSVLNTGKVWATVDFDGKADGKKEIIISSGTEIKVLSSDLTVLASRDMGESILNLVLGQTGTDGRIDIIVSLPSKISIVRAASTVDLPNAPVLNNEDIYPSDGKVYIAWLYTPSSAPLSGFRIYRSSDGITWNKVGEVAANVNSYVDSPPDGTYSYKVSAFNDYGEIFSSASDPVEVISGEESSTPSSCFIATAAYGTPMAKEVVKLRKFRDEYLMRSRIGRAFVRWYYRHSPRVAEYIRKRNWARALVRASLRPLLWLITAIGN